MKLYSFAIFVGLIISAFAAGPVKVELPNNLCQFYSNFATTCKSGEEDKIRSFLLPGAVEVSVKPRTDHHEYGSDINIPFVKEYFSDQILGVSQPSASVYSIRTATTYISFVETATEGWKIFRYGDKPVE